MNFEDRLVIERELTYRKGLKQIGELIGKSRTTILREVTLRSVWVKSGAPYKRFNDCAYRNSCRVLGNCDNKGCKRSKCSYCDEGCGANKCSNYKKEECNKLKKNSQVCNGCQQRSKCTLEKRMYEAAIAQQEYQELLAESREGVAITEDEAREIGAIIRNGISKGQSFYHIIQSNMPKIQYSERSLYTYTTKGVFEGVGNGNLPRQVRYRKRKSTRHDALKLDKRCREGRTFEDYNAFCKENPDEPIVEMDCVESTKGDVLAALLTLHFTNVHLQLAFLLQHKTSAEVEQCFNEIKAVLGKDMYKLLFSTILTDNGTEFSNPTSIEQDPDGELVTRIFYCDPKRSEQKGHCEKNHEHIRCIIPKGTKFSSIGLTQDKVNLMMSHVNSYKRRKDLGGKTPFEAFESFYKEGVLKKLGVSCVAGNDVTLKPQLLK